MLGNVKRNEIVEKILKDNLIVKYGFDPIDISNGIDWEYSHTHNSKTYSVYLHALEYIGYLALAGIEKDDNTYFEIASDIIMNWIEYNKNNTPLHSWNEHAVSYRISNLILFQESVDENYKIKNEDFQKVLLEHCVFLADEKNYKPNNHGILMDESLFKASFHITDIELQEIYKNVALNRVKLALYRDFSRKGLHSENSPEYHRMMMIVLNRFNELIQEKGMTLTNDLNHKLKKAKRILRILLKPNMTYPLVGDTSLKLEDNIKKIYEDFYDYEAGLTIFQKENELDRMSSDYLYFKCGYLSKTHKHFDDLSLTLVLDGNDILIDSGKYNYDKLDKIRQYMLSPEAHSVPLISNKTYSPSSPIVDQYNLGIDYVSINNENKIVRGFNNLYDGINLSRTVIYTEFGHVFIFDSMISDTEEILIQNFNLNETATIEEQTDTQIKIGIGKNKYIFYCLNEDVEITLKDGFYSMKFSEYKENKHLQFKQQVNTGESLILVCNEEILPEFIELTNKAIHYKHRGKTYVINIQ